MASKDKKAPGASVTREAQSEVRKNEIVQAFARSVRKRGFSKTSLTNIAIEAEMSPSHIRYYFEGKEAIVETYLETTCAQILDRIREIKTDDPERWFDEFTSFVIENSWITPARLSVQMEIFGSSVHDEKLKRIKVDYDREMRNILQSFFEDIGCAEELTPMIAAEIAQALEAGLKYNAVFQEKFDPVHARLIYTSGIRVLTGTLV